MLNVGIVGLSPVWETRYAPAFHKVASRIRVRAVYDVVASRAQQAAQAFECEAVQGVLSLIARADVQALMILDRGWQDRFPLESLVHCEKPGYIAGSFGDQSHFVASLQAEVEQKGLTVMPEFSRRFTPATTRLKELIATKLGQPRFISIETTLPSAGVIETIPGRMNETDFLVGWFDWCRYVLRTEPRQILSTGSDQLAPPDATLDLIPQFLEPCEISGGQESTAAQIFDRPPCRTMRIDFQKKRPGQDSPVVLLKLFRPENKNGKSADERGDEPQDEPSQSTFTGNNGVHSRQPEACSPPPHSPTASTPMSSSPTSSSADIPVSVPSSPQPNLPPLRLVVRCERGIACLNSDQEIIWSTDTGPVVETLRFDRSEIEVMLDHFCRRVVGGLIPIPDIRDVYLSLEMVRAAGESHALSRAIPLS